MRGGKHREAASCILKSIIIISCILLIGTALRSVYAQPSVLSATYSFAPVASYLPASDMTPNLSAPLPSPTFDEQLGLTFTQNSTSLSYNVTAIPQNDSYGYGPSCLINGLSDDGNWSQVGLAYNWPNSGGYTPGFTLAYEFFNSSGQSIFPASGGGGLQHFSGPVNSGDSVQLRLYINNGIIYMSGQDWNTGATASQSYADMQTTTFIGLSYYTSAHGFFSGLMTAWWHVNSYYGDELQVTYSNYSSALSSSWMWMDEWEPSNSSWSGNWIYYTQVDYTSTPTQLHSFSNQGANELSNAYEFLTGSLGSQTTSITLLPAGGSTSLTGTNEFTVLYTLGGQTAATFVQNGTLRLNTDNNTQVLILGVSNGSTSNEKWVLALPLTNVTLASGLDYTFYYYDILTQQVSYAVSGGGNPGIPILTYVTAPPSASAESNQTTTSLSLSQSPQSISVLRGTFVSMSNPLNGTAQEQWIAPTSSWAISQSNQIPASIVYYHQYQITANYSTADGSVPSSNIMLSGTKNGTSFQIALNGANQAVWLDVNTGWSTTSISTASSGTERWTCSTGNAGTVTGIISISPIYAHQYYLTVTSSYGRPSGSGWYNNGATAYAYLPFSAISVDIGTQYVLSGWGGDSSGTAMLSNGITMNSAKTANALWQIQYYLTIISPHGSGNPASGWFNTGTIIREAIPSILSAPPGKQYVCTGWTGTGSISSSGTNSSTTFTITQPSSLDWNWKTQYYLNSSTNFGSVTPGNGWQDAGTIVNITATAPLVQPGERFIWNGWSGNVGKDVANNAALLTINEPINATASWIHQYLLTVNSLYGLPSPSTNWFNAGTNSTLSISSPTPESIILQHVATGWNGTGSIPTAGTTTSLNTIIDQPSSITWNWKSQLILSRVLLVIGIPLILVASVLIYLLKFKRILRKPKSATPV